MKRLCVLVACLVTVGAVPSADAQIIFNNGLARTEVNFGSFSFTSTLTGNQFQVADDFMLAANPSGWMVRGASWTGGFLNRDLGGFQNVDGVTFTFDLLFFADNGGMPTGTPVDPVPGTAIAHRQVTVTGYDGFGDREAEYIASFDPILLQGGTRYWMTVAALGDFTWDEATGTGAGWTWFGRSGTGNAWQGGTDFTDNWIQQGRQQQFTLSGTAVPEPSTLALIGLGLAGLAARRRKRHTS